MNLIDGKKSFAHTIHISQIRGQSFALEGKIKIVGSQGMDMWNLIEEKERPNAKCLIALKMCYLNPIN